MALKSWRWPPYLKHHLGQHFLCDRVLLERLVDHINPQPTDQLLEIGAGVGALTVHLLPRLKHLTVVEIDETLIPLLRANCGTAAAKLTILQQDILQVDLQQLNLIDNQPVSVTATSTQSIRLVGNLPYNISTPLLFHLIHQLPIIQDMHFMLQKEVAQRLIAPPGSSNYGRLSVMAQYHYRMQLLELIPPHVFRPPPQVDSAFIRFQPKGKGTLEPDTDVAPTALATNYTLLEQLVRDSFSARRKTIANALKKWLNVEDWNYLSTTLGVQPQWRPQQLAVADYVAISNYLVAKSARPDTGI